MCRDEEATVDECTAKVKHSHSDHETIVKVIDDCGNEEPYRRNQWYVLGYEFGPTHIIRARGESSAYEIWIDEQPTIEANEVHEAYDAMEKLVDHLVKCGHEETSTLRGFAIRWASLFFAMSISDTTNDNRWDEWPLDEAYEMQSNATGTGIVNVGHYAWHETLNASGYTAKFSGLMS